MAKPTKPKRPTHPARPPKPRGRGRARPHLATVLAWFILLVGVGAFIWAVRGRAPVNPELAQTPAAGNGAPTPEVAATPRAAARSTTDAEPPRRTGTVSDTSRPKPASSPTAVAPRVATGTSNRAPILALPDAADGRKPEATADPAGVSRPPFGPPSRPQVHSPEGDLLAPEAAANARRPRIAIILDDIGADLEALETALRLPCRLTLSVIPYLRHSREAAHRAHKRGFEVMLHLPMEPLAYPREDPGRGAVLVSMQSEEIRRTVLTDLASVPHVRGVNNHMGSRITSDRTLMRQVLEALSATPYFFIDSRTSENSVAYAIARELRIPAAERTVFLDDVVMTGEINKQIDQLHRLARARGQAIAIGHPHALTLKALKEQIPRLKKAGVEFVFASELVL